MADLDDTQAAEGRIKRGEAAWKAAKDAIAERNEQARKAARKERHAHERSMVERRRRLS
jgi:hypothetical protein